MRFLLISAFLMAPGMALAAGGDSFTPPTPTETTTTCTGSKIWDAKTRSCVDSRESALTDQDRYEAVRELAYAGDYMRAKRVLASFEAPDSSAAQTYQGFIARKTGDMDAAFDAYAKAIAADPENILARSYMGQAFVTQGDTGAAREQLSEIRARGGRETWAEFALESAIRTGQGYAY